MTLNYCLKHWLVVRITWKLLTWRLPHPQLGKIFVCSLGGDRLQCLYCTGKIPQEIYTKRRKTPIWEGGRLWLRGGASLGDPGEMLPIRIGNADCERSYILVLQFSAESCSTIPEQHSTLFKYRTEGYSWTDIPPPSAKWFLEQVRNCYRLLR